MAATTEEAAGAVAGLREFLTSRCGGARPGFDAINVHEVGQLTSDAFSKGLRRLGFQGDAAALFRSLDSARTGLLSRRAFLIALGDPATGETEDDDSSSLNRSVSSCKSMDSAQMNSTQASAWGSACIPRLGSDSQLPRPPRHKKALPRSNSSNSLLDPARASAQASMSSAAGAGAPNEGAAAAAACVEEMEARLARLEERLETTQRDQAREASAADASLSEQLDSLRQQLLEEREARAADAAALRATLAVAQTEARTLATEAEARARQDWIGSLESLRKELLERLASSDDKAEEAVAKLSEEGATATKVVEAATAKADAAVERLDTEVASLRSELEARLKALEAATSLDETREVAQRPGSQEVAGVGEDQLRELRGELSALRQRVEAAEAGAEELRNAAEVSAKKAVELSADEERRVREAKQSIYDLEKRCSALQVQMDATQKVGSATGSRAASPAAAAEDPPCSLRQLRASEERLEKRLDELADTVDCNSRSTAHRFAALDTDRAINEAPVGCDRAEVEHVVADRLAVLRREVTDLSEKQASDISDLGGRLAALEYDDRLGALDTGLARLTGDVRAQGESLERSQAEHRQFSSDVRSRLTSLLSKVEESPGFVGLSSSGSLPSSEGAGNGCFSHRLAPAAAAPVQGAQGPRLLGSLSAQQRSQSCGDLKSPAGRGAPFCGDGDEAEEAPLSAEAEATLQALREENLRLREENVGMREFAAHTSTATFAESKQGSAQACASPMVPSRQVVAPAMGVPLQVRPAIILPTAAAAPTAVVRMPSYGAPVRGSLSKVGYQQTSARGAPLASAAAAAAARAQHVPTVAHV